MTKEWHWRCWNEQAWQRHLELSKGCPLSGAEKDWHFYDRDDCLHNDQGGTIHFLNSVTAQECQFTLTHDQIRTMIFGSKLIENLDFLTLPQEV